MILTFHRSGSTGIPRMVSKKLKSNKQYLALRAIILGNNESLKEKILTPPY